MVTWNIIKHRRVVPYIRTFGPLHFLGQSPGKPLKVDWDAVLPIKHRDIGFFGVVANTFGLEFNPKLSNTTLCENTLIGLDVKL